MSDPVYTRRYFSDGARRWLDAAYVHGPESLAYPLGSQRVRLALTAAVDPHDRPRQRIHVIDVRRAGGSEIALVRKVRTLRVLNARDKLGNQEIDV